MKCYFCSLNIYVLNRIYLCGRNTPRVGHIYHVLSCTARVFVSYQEAVLNGRSHTSTAASLAKRIEATLTASAYSSEGGSGGGGASDDDEGVRTVLLGYQSGEREEVG